MEQCKSRHQIYDAEPEYHQTSDSVRVIPTEVDNQQNVAHECCKRECCKKDVVCSSLKSLDLVLGPNEGVYCIKLLRHVKLA